MCLCDVFVVMDDVQYLSQDWNNRNRIKGPNGAFWLSLPIDRKRSSSGQIKDIWVQSQGWGTRKHWQAQHWESIRRSYTRAPYWNEYSPFLEEFYTGREHLLLAEINLTLLKFFMKSLGITPEIIVASEFGFEGKKSDLILDHCVKLGANACVFGSQGRNYANIGDFQARGIGVYFDEYNHPTYQQLFREFVSNLSVLDLLFNCGPNSFDVLMSGNIDRSGLEELITDAAQGS